MATRVMDARWKTAPIETLPAGGGVVTLTRPARLDGDSLTAFLAAGGQLHCNGFQVLIEPGADGCVTLPIGGGIHGTDAGCDR